MEQGGAPAAGGTLEGEGGAAGHGGSGETEAPLKTELQRLPADGFYPRVLKLARGTIVASVVGQQKSGHLGGTIFESTDDGLTFRTIGHIDEPTASGGLCCGTLYELGRAFAGLPAGALLWAASVGADQTAVPMSIPVWSSVDAGRTWAPLSTIIPPAIAGSTHHGVWEPELSLLDDGTLVCYFSDERDPAHSQKLVAVSTKDGKNWSAPRDTVALAAFGNRPGMAVVRRGPTGVFFMSYEVCGVTGDSCTAHFRTSPDGAGWGDPTDIGKRPATVDGKHLVHAPTLLWSESPSSLGRFYMVGQIAADASGNPTADNGNYVLANAQGGQQFWYGIPAPAPVVPAPYDNFCPNYSSSLIALDGGKVGLELASRWDGKVCRTYFARGPLLGSGDASGVTSGSAYRFVNVTSGMCLGVAGGSKQAHAQAQQLTCDGSAPQQWAVTSAANGTFTIRSKNSGECLAAVGASQAGTLLEQAACDASAIQSWTLQAVGNGYFAVEQPGGLCIDDPAASTKTGTALQLWSCNDLSPQIWQLDPQ